MERKTVAGWGAAAVVGAAAGTFSLEGANISLNLAEVGPVALLILGLVVLVGYIIVALAKGWVIVKLHYDTLLERAVAAETANTKLAETNATLVNINDVQARTIEKQTAVGDTVEKVMGAIQDARASAGGTP